MKYPLIVLLILTTAVAEAYLVDDFESYALGNVASPLPFLVSSTATLLFDIYAKSEINIDDAFGLTDGTAGATSADDYSDFGPYIRFTDDAAFGFKGPQHHQTLRHPHSRRLDQEF